MPQLSVLQPASEGTGPCCVAVFHSSSSMFEVAVLYRQPVLTRTRLAWCSTPLCAAKGRCPLQAAAPSCLPAGNGVSCAGSHAA